MYVARWDIVEMDVGDDTQVVGVGFRGPRNDADIFHGGGVNQLVSENHIICPIQ